MKSKFKIFIKISFFAFLTYLSLEVLFRRWVWHQIPTQISGVFCYLLVIANGAFIGEWIWRLRAGRTASMTKTDRS